MTDVIWQQHNYHRPEPQTTKIKQQYGPEHPERIHFNVSDDQVNPLIFSTQEPSKVTFSTVNNKSKPDSPVNTTTTNNNQDLLLDRRSNTSVNTKWSIATEDIQNPQVISYFDCEIQIKSSKNIYI